MGNIEDLKTELEGLIVKQTERVEIVDYHQRLGYNFTATVNFYIDDVLAGVIHGGDWSGWTSQDPMDIYGDYFDEVTDTIRTDYLAEEQRKLRS